MLGYIVAFCIGGLFGFTISAIMSSSGYSTNMQEAYDTGYRVGFETGLKSGKDEV